MATRVEERYTELFVATILVDRFIPRTSCLENIMIFLDCKSVVSTIGTLGVAPPP